MGGKKAAAKKGSKDTAKPAKKVSSGGAVPPPKPVVVKHVVLHDLHLHETADPKGKKAGKISKGSVVTQLV